MRLNIEDLLNDRMTHPILSNEDTLIQSVKENKENVLYFISVEKHTKQAIKLSNYNISAIFDLANPFANTDIRFYLIKLTKNLSEYVKISVYNDKLVMGRADRETWKYPQWKLKENISKNMEIGCKR